LPLPKESDIWYNRLFGVLFLVLGVVSLYDVYKNISNSFDPGFFGALGAVSPGLICLIEASYFFFRYDRHKRLYETHILGVKKLVDKDLSNGMPPPDEELDVPIYDQV